MDRSRFLLVMGADPTRWAARYGIEPFSHPCNQCGTELSTTIPFAFQSLRGLMAPQCATCGNAHTPYCAVSSCADGDLFTGRSTATAKPEGMKQNLGAIREFERLTRKSDD